VVPSPSGSIVYFVADPDRITRGDALWPQSTSNFQIPSAYAWVYVTP
jgi:hypothetical protein